MACGEFDVITRFFTSQQVNRQDVKLGIGDDCALLKVPENNLLAVSTDSLVSGVHFLADIDPADLAYKALMVNLSDLAAMGAAPAWVSLAITLPEVDEVWLTAFSKSFFSLLDYYQMQLVGGDTTKGPLSLTLTVHGTVPDIRQMTRRGARIGDWIYVSGSLGDSAAGLAILQQRLQVSDEKERDYLLQRHLRPQARILTGQAVREIANAAIDVSDGLISDLSHILKASGCGARIDLNSLPLSQPLRNNVSAEQALEWGLAGGEDYELCFTVPEIHRGELETRLRLLGVACTCIGQIAPAADKLRFFRGKSEVTLNLRGYDHFGDNHG